MTADILQSIVSVLLTVRTRRWETWGWYFRLRYRLYKQLQRTPFREVLRPGMRKQMETHSKEASGLSGFLDLGLSLRGEVTGSLFSGLPFFYLIHRGWPGWSQMSLATRGSGISTLTSLPGSWPCSSGSSKVWFCSAGGSLALGSCSLGIWEAWGESKGHRTQNKTKCKQSRKQNPRPAVAEPC